MSGRIGIGVVSGEEPSPLDELRAAFSPESSRTGELAVDVPAFLNGHGHAATAEHSERVAAEAARIARRFGADVDAAEAAGWLHDISAVFPAAERVSVARQLGIDVLPAEDAFPMIVHQKLSVAVARVIFDVCDESVLSAIGCHTTLRRDATQLDKVLFVADKIAWDQFGEPPYLDALLAALGSSLDAAPDAAPDAALDAAAYCYLEYLWEQRRSLRVIHPWAVDAHAQLAHTLRHPPKSWQ